MGMRRWRDEIAAIIQLCPFDRLENRNREMAEKVCEMTTSEDFMEARA